jgi:transketolase
VQVGAYVLSAEEKSLPLQAILIATGSEISIALEAQQKLQQHKINARVVSAPSLEIFAAQSEEYKNEILAKNSAQKIKLVAIEAAVSQGWHSIIGSDGIFVGMKSFGASGKAEDLFKHFGITADAVVEEVIRR